MMNSEPSSAATAGLVEKKSVVSQRTKAAASKGQKSSSDNSQPVVYYPKSLGYADGVGSSSTSEDEERQSLARKVLLLV